MKKNYKIIIVLLLAIVVVFAIIVSETKNSTAATTAIVEENIESENETQNESDEQVISEGETAAIIYQKSKTDDTGETVMPEPITISMDSQDTKNETVAESTPVAKRHFTSLYDKDRYFFKEIENIYTDDTVTSEYLEFDMAPLKERTKRESDLIYTMALCGDSYCGFLSKYLGTRKNFKGTVNASAGKDVIENKEIFEKTITGKEDIIIISTSVNDVLKQTDLKEFKETIEELFQLAYDNHKLLLIHTNCDFLDNNGKSVNKSMQFDILPKYYDWILIISAEKYDNVVYVNCNDITKPEELIDGVHYNEDFYNILVDRIYFELQQKYGFLRNNA